VCPGNPWDLKNCRHKPNETLCEYIHCFSRQCNELPNVADVDVIGAFLSETTYEFLVHKLGCKRPRTTKLLLDIATSHALVRRRLERFSTAPMARPSGTPS
jgi:hypothetical protein